MDPSRVKILDSQYKEEKDLIVWTLKFLETGDEQTFCWPSGDLLEAFNINSKKVEPEHLHDFCLAMQGKEINFVVDGIPEYSLPKSKEGNDPEITDKIVEHFETFRTEIENG